MRPCWLRRSSRLEMTRSQSVSRNCVPARRQPSTRRPKRGPNVIAREGPLPPGSTIGILGGGQLGRMLAMAAAELGFRVHIYNDEASCPAFDVAAGRTSGAFTDLEKLMPFAQSVDVVTYEFENVPVEAARHLATFVPVRPGPK